MKQIINKTVDGLLFSLLMIVIILPSFVYGQTGTGGSGAGSGTGGTGSGAGTGSDAGGSGPGGISGSQIIKLKNPLKVDSIADLLALILQIVTIFAVPIIVFFIIYAGFLYVTAQGNETKLTKAHNALLYSIIGGVIILGAHVLLAVIQGTVGSLLAP